MLEINLKQYLEEINTKLPNGIQFVVESNRITLTGDASDAIVGLRMGNGDSYTFKTEIKRIHRKESLRSLLEEQNHPAELPTLLVCNALTDSMAAYCEMHGINFLDSAGNASIHLSGLHFVVRGMKDDNVISDWNNSQPRISEGTLKLLFILLSQPETINLPYRSLATLAGISLGMVSKAFDYLKNQREYRDSKKGRRLTDAEKLMSLWLQEYSTTLRPKLNSIRLESPIDWTSIELTSDEVWGGEAAANLLGDGYLLPENLQLFTFLPLANRSAELGLKNSNNGTFLLTHAFWGNTFELNMVAKAMLSIAELIASNDHRNLEAARMINDQYLNLSEAAISRY